METLSQLRKNIWVPPFFKIPRKEKLSCLFTNASKTLVSWRPGCNSDWLRTRSTAGRPEETKHVMITAAIKNKVNSVGKHQKTHRLSKHTFGTCARARKHTHRQTHTFSHTHSLTDTHQLRHTHTLSQTHTHAHRHRHTGSSSSDDSGVCQFQLINNWSNQCFVCVSGFFPHSFVFSSSGWRCVFSCSCLVSFGGRRLIPDRKFVSGHLKVLRYGRMSAPPVGKSFLFCSKICQIRFLFNQIFRN